MDARSRIVDNPFYVLGLRPDCSRVEVEREGQKLLAMLEVGLSSAKHYPTPLGGMPRSADQVRQAMAELRDPERRLLHELWAAMDPDPEQHLDDDPAPSPEGPPPWPEAGRALGWRR